MSEEQVFVVPRTEFFAGEWPQGWWAGREDLAGAFAGSGRFVARPQAEEDPSLKQVIPYCVIQCEDRLLCVQRLKAQTEGRLHGLWSIGIGGHVGPEDRPDTTGGFGPAACRELEEELRLPGPVRADQLEHLGWINDDRTAVGSVHVGLALRLRVAPTAWPAVAIREVEKMRGVSASLDDLRGREAPIRNNPDRVVGPPAVWHDPGCWESWSRTLLEEGSLTS